MTELEPTSPLPTNATPQSLGDLLAGLMWVEQIDLGFGGTRLRGFIKPDKEAETPAAQRQKFLASFETILRLLDEVGVKHGQHPEFTISGDRVEYTLDGGQEFYGMRAEVELNVWLPERF